MAKETINNLKLGIFITIGLALLVTSLYLIGRNQSYFGANLHVKARFANVSGLMPGNNIRFDGIQAGTVNNITVLNDTDIEVDLHIDKSMRPFIRKNSYVSIGNDGLMGNKVVNITPNPIPAPQASGGDILVTKTSPGTEDMMATFSNTNKNVEKISESLINTMNRINSSKAFWNILNDSTIPLNLSATMANLRSTSNRLNDLTASLTGTINDVRGGKGAIGLLLEDKQTEENVRQSIEKINKAATESAEVMAKTDSLMARIQHDYAHGHGPVQALLKDSSMVGKMNHSLTNLEKGTLILNQDLEALQHNFLTKRYFRNQAKHKKDTAQ